MVVVDEMLLINWDKNCAWYALGDMMATSVDLSKSGVLFSTFRKGLVPALDTLSSTVRYSKGAALS